MKHFRKAMTFLLFPALFGLCSGCSTVKKIQHMSPLLTLKNYSDEQDKIASYVERQDKLFDELVAAIKAGSFVEKKAKEIRARFGDPVFTRPMDYQGVAREQWLYRYAKAGTSDKVYLYFDSDGNLADVVYVLVVAAADAPLSP